MTAFTIPAARFDDVNALVSRFARKSAKLGMATPVLVEVARFTNVWHVSKKGNVLGGPWIDGLPCCFIADKVYVETADFVTIEILGERPIVAGWQFVAVIEATPAGNMLRKSPDFDGDLPVHFRNCTSECDHCQVARQRNETFVLQAVDGEREFKQVGRTCLQDFLGSASPDAWMARFMFEKQLAAFMGDEDDFGGGERSVAAITLLGFLAMVSASIREFGFTSAAQARDAFCKSSTGDDVFHGATNKDRTISDAYYNAITDKDRDVARGALEWLASDAVGNVNDYIHNLRVAAAADIVTSKRANLLASLLPAYNRDLGKRVERATKLNEHLPGASVKQRVDLELTMVAAISFDTMYGTKWIMRFEDVDGRTFVWKTTVPGNSYGVGDRVAVRGTVKELGEYKGTKQTELTRCKITKLDVAAAA